MKINRIISDVLWWWRKRHPGIRKLPSWRRAADAYNAAKRRGCTQDIGKARKAMQEAVLNDLRGECVMAWRRQSTSRSVDIELDEFTEEQLLQGLVDAKWITEQGAEAVSLRKAKEEARPVFASNDADELDEARDNLRRGRKTEALIHLERFLGREWSGMLQ